MVGPIAIDLGDLFRLTFTNLSPAKAPVTAGSMTLTITLPDGTATTPVVVTAGSVGVYQYDYQTVQAGRHAARWVGTGINPGAQGQAFDVRPAEAPYIISLDDAKAQLNMTGTANDEELRGYIGATTGIIERYLGLATVRRTFVEDHWVNQNANIIALNWSPVATLISVVSVDGFRTWNVVDLHTSPSGVVTPVRGAGLFGLAGQITVTYIAGLAIIPEQYIQAAKVIVQHLWETQRGRSGNPRAGGMDIRSGFSLPRAAEELLGQGNPGFA